MKKQSHTVPRRRQSASPASRHLPLVDILIDAQAELQELVIASGLRVLEAMLEEDRANIRDLLAQSHILAHTLIDQPFGLRRTGQIGCVVFEPTEQRVWQRAAELKRTTHEVM